MSREKYRHRNITDRIYFFLREQRTRSPEKLRWTFKNALKKYTPTKNVVNRKLSLRLSSRFKLISSLLMNSKLGKCYSYVEMISKKISQAQRTDGENDLG